MSNLAGFNANNHEPNEGFDVLPAGTYPVAIVASKTKPTKNGTGELLEIELQVLKGECQNRKIWDRINIKNQNPTAQQIGLGTLSAICRAVGVLTPNDSSDLHNRPLMAKVKITRQEGYSDKNEVVKYSSMEGGAMEHATASAAPSGGASSSW